MHQILLIDNFDSFTYNLVHYLEGFGAQVEVVRNDVVDESHMQGKNGVVLSPGPGLPQEAGRLMSMLTYMENIPVLGVCLGCQAMGIYTGATLRNLNPVLHGVSSFGKIERTGVLFHGFGEAIEMGHYHSWVVDDETLSSNWKVTVRHEDGFVMAMEHGALPWFGVQFHPESVLTPEGKKIIYNWLSYLSATC
jgi:anthranilate synthase component II